MSVPNKYFLVLTRQQHMTLRMGLNEACTVYNYHVTHSSSDTDIKYNSNKLKSTQALIRKLEKCEKEDPASGKSDRAGAKSDPGIKI